jgi:phosphoribosylformimino-5-aminoimidazole carboxamide ribotide isomerase
MVSKKRNKAQSVSDETKFTTNFSRTAISLAVAAALPGAAFAQTGGESSEQIEEIVVTGFASSILDSIQSKRSSDVVSEVIDSGDLSALPDMSVAEALGRLPGVTTVRANGQSTALNIRGLNGGFVQSTLNGREQASSGGGETPTRWVSFDMYPTELIQQAAVYKSPKASLIEGGVAGTVELKTVNPLLQSQEHSFNINLRYGNNDSADEVGAKDDANRITASYTGKLLDDKLGVALGFATLEQSNNSSTSRVGTPRTHGSPDYTYYQEIFVEGSVGQDERDSYTASFIFEPIDTLTLKADYFKTEMSSEENQNGIAFEIRNAVPVTNPIFASGTTTLLGATIAADSSAGSWAELRTFNNTFDTETESLGFNVDWQINDRFTAQFDYTSSEALSARDGLKVGFRPTDPAVRGTTGPGSFASLVNDITYLAPQNGSSHLQLSGQGFDDLTDLSLVQFFNDTATTEIYTDELDAYKLDFQLEVDAGPISSIEFGYRSSERTWIADEPTFVWGNGIDQGNINDPVFNAPFDLNEHVQLTPYTGSMARFGAYLDITDQQAFLDASFGPGNHDAVKTWAYNWTVINSGLATDEDTDAYYLMANFGFEMGDTPVSGNFGVRVVETSQIGTGVYQTNDPNSFVTDDLGVSAAGYDIYPAGQKYTDTLPSLNLAFDITDNDIIRFAAAEVISRPPVQHMRAGGGSWCNTVETDWTGGICDPNDPSNAGLTVKYNVWAKGGPGAIDPFQATQFDLSYEHYFDEGGAATVALFYKDIDAFVESIVFSADNDNTAQMEADGIIIPFGVRGGQYETSRMNDQGGYIRGIELGYTQPFTNLPGVWSGLGFSGSYSYTESDTSIDGGDNFGNVNIPLPGLSENVWTATVWWDIGRFSARASTRYRDEFINEGVAPGGTNLQWAGDYMVTDMQFSYAFDMGLDLLFQINNLTDEEDRTFFADGEPGRYTTFGTQYFIGVNYRQ